MFLEQAAICFLRGQPAMPRKYAFHLFLSSHLFLKAGLREHAILNYETSSSIYGDMGWTLISDHINFALGKQAIQRGEFSLAVDFFIKLLHKSQQTATVHRAYLAEFLYLFQQFAGIADAAHVSEKMAFLPIPDLSDKSLVLVSKDPLLSSKQIGAVDPEENSIWESLEQKMKNALPKLFAAAKSDAKIDGSLESAVGGK
jgi:hypothetical protein